MGWCQSKFSTAMGAEVYSLGFMYVRYLRAPDRRGVFYSAAMGCTAFDIRSPLSACQPSLACRSGDQYLLAKTGPWPSDRPQHLEWLRDPNNGRVPPMQMHMHVERFYYVRLGEKETTAYLSDISTALRGGEQHTGMVDVLARHFPVGCLLIKPLCNAIR
jgi:hypothetical protein